MIPADKQARAHAKREDRNGSQMQPIDLLVSARWVIPVEPPETVLADHGVAVAGGRILAVLPTAEAERRYRPAERVRLDRHALIPGLVNLHTHASPGTHHPNSYTTARCSPAPRCCAEA